MIIRRFYSVLRLPFLVLIFTSLFQPTIWGQADLQSDVVYKEGRISEALHASMIPDNRTIGVYLTVGKQNELSPQEWASTVEKYFRAYGFPVKIFLYYKRPKGKGATAIIYIGAKAYQGNLSSGSVSLSHLLTRHEKVFGELFELYKKANPDLFAPQK